jgi:hypothetical protein
MRQPGRDESRSNNSIAQTQGREFFGFGGAIRAAIHQIFQSTCPHRCHSQHMRRIAARINPTIESSYGLASHIFGE